MIQFEDITSQVAHYRNDGRTDKGLPIPDSIVVHGDELKLYNPKKVLVFDDNLVLARHAQGLVKDTLINSPKPVIFATGRTMLLPYAEMAGERDEFGRLLADRAFANLDGVSKVIPRSRYLGRGMSFRVFMEDNLFHPIFGRRGTENLNWVMPDESAPDVYEEAERWESNLIRLLRQETTSFALSLLSVGPDGDPTPDGAPAFNSSPHLAFAPPDIRLETVAQVVKLDEGTRRANSRDGIAAHYFEHALTMGVALPVLDTEIPLFIARGGTKPRNVKAILESDPRYKPAVYLLGNPNTVMLLDREAASQILTRL